MSAAVQYSTELSNTATAGASATITFTWPDFAAMRKELLAEAEAWRSIAASVAERGFSHGLCDEITVWSHAGDVGTNRWATRRAMQDRVRRHLDGEVYLDDCGSALRFGRHDHQQIRAGRRVLAALFLALECEDQARELTPKPARSQRAGKAPSGPRSSAKRTDAKRRSPR